MKKIALILLLIIIIVMALGGCSKEPSISNNEENFSELIVFPEKDITLYCGYAPGGGSDVSMRLLVPYLKKELGVNVNVVNVPGGGGFVGWLEALEQPADGYTISQINFPGLIGGIINPEYDYGVTLDNFKFLANQTIEYDTLVIKANDKRFSTAKEFIEYAQNNELIAGDGGVGSNKHLSALAMIKNFSAKLECVHQAGWSATYTSMLGDTVDVGWGAVPEAIQGYQDGELDILCVFGRERSSYLPDIPTFNELDLGAEIVTEQYRGFFVHPDTPEEIFKILEKAFANAMQNEEYKKSIMDMYYIPYYLNGEDFKKAAMAQHEWIEDYREVLGW